MPPRDNPHKTRTSEPSGAIVSGGKGTAAAKMDALRDAGVEVGLNPTEAGELMAQVVAKL